MNRSITLLLLSVATVFISRRPVPAAGEIAASAKPGVADSAQSGARPDSVLWIEMRNVDMHINPRSVMRIKSLRGQVTTDSESIA